MDDGDGSNLQGAAAAEGGVPRVWSGGRGGVPTDEPSEPERRGMGRPPPSTGRPKLTGSLSPNVCSGSSDRGRGAWEGLQIGPTSRFTVMHGTQ